MKRTKTVLRVLLSLFILESVFAIHEFGHLKEFQKRDISVKEFSLGIGPRVYQYQTASFVISLRLIPIMAYVAPTKESWNLFKEQGSLRDKIVVDTAGVRNNFLMGLIIAFFLQVLGWTRGNLSVGELMRTAVVTPFKILLRFFSFLVGCITWGRVNLAEKFLLSTGGVDPPKPLKQLILWNLMLGLFNLAPIIPLDGGHVIEAILLSAGNYIHIPQIPNFVSIILFVVFYTIANEQDMRVLEIEPKKKSKRGRIPCLLSTRVTNLLRDSGIYTFRLQEITARQLMQIKGFDPKSLAEVEVFLSQRGLSLRLESGITESSESISPFNSNRAIITY